MALDDGSSSDGETAAAPGPMEFEEALAELVPMYRGCAWARAMFPKSADPSATTMPKNLVGFLTFPPHTDRPARRAAALCTSICMHTAKSRGGQKLHAEQNPAPSGSL